MKKFPPIWIWQRSLSPHFSLLADDLVGLGAEVTAVFSEPISEDRLGMGWQAAHLLKARTILASDRTAIKHLVNEAPIDAVHLTQGLARNGLVGYAQYQLRRKGARIWVNLETIDNNGWRGRWRRIEYGVRLRYLGNWIERVLAIGADTPSWLVRRGFPADRVSPFTYFLPKSINCPLRDGGESKPKRPVRLVFVGTLIANKCVADLLCAAEGARSDEFQITIIGDGPLRSSLEIKAKKLAGAVSFRGYVPITKIRQLLRSEDVLVLPSRHDGWGAVVSEALIEGCRVICSDGCGASVVVRASGAGIVYPAGNVLSLRKAFRTMISSGPVSQTERKQIADWARCLTAPAGAAYLTDLLISPDSPAPWNKPGFSS